MFNSKIKLIIIALLIVIVSSLIWFLPILYKGYPPIPVNRNHIPARNLYFSDVPATESVLGVYLNSSQVKNHEVIEQNFNKLTYLIYSKIYDLTGFSIDKAQYVTIVIFALLNAFLFLFLAGFFNFTVGLIFSLTTIFTPIIWQSALMPAYYEWGLMFFILGFICYWLKDRTNLWFLLLSGIFFSLAILSRNALFFSVVAVGIFELINKRSIKRIIIFGLPMIFLFLAPLSNSYLKGESFYINKNSFANYSHCFPDSYTYNFEKESYLNSVGNTEGGRNVNCPAEHGYQQSFGQIIVSTLTSAKFYLIESFKLITFGGPIIWLFLIIGFFELKKKQPVMLNMFIVWVIVWFIGQILLRTGNWNHLLEIWIPYLTLVSFGIYRLGRLIFKELTFKNRLIKNLIMVVFALLFLGHNLIASKWMFHEEYNTSRTDDAILISEAINKMNIKDEDIVALDHQRLDMINYYTDKSVVQFSTVTIKKLLTENKLDSIFKYYGVTKVVGYDSELTKEIVSQTQVDYIPFGN